MEINLKGNIYVYFIRSIFDGNKKIGLEFIIDPKRSNTQLVDGLKRLNYLNGNKFNIYNDNYSDNFDKLSTKYTGEFDFTSIYNDDNYKLKLNSINIIEKDKIVTPQREVNKKIFLSSYSTGKNKTVSDIMNIIKSS
jgi:hypothetical protein